MTSRKRRISDLISQDTSTSNDPDERPHVKPRLSSPSTNDHRVSALDPPSAERKLSFPTRTSWSPTRPIPFQQPSPLLSFSYDATRTMDFTNSALRYFVQPPREAQLSYGYELWVRRPEEKGRIDSLVKAWDKACKDVGGRMDVGVVSWRGVMTKILTSPYEERDGWEMNVMWVNGTMYFEEHLSDARIREKNNMDDRQRRQTYFGYAFESYCTSSAPGRREENRADNPGWGGDVDTNIQWCCVVKTKLGETRMVIGGEVDCVRDQYTGKTDSFVELKTSLSIRGPQDEAKFERKLLKFYFQSFLLGVPEIVVGFRLPSGKVVSVQSFRTIQIPRLVRGKPGAWDPLLCLEWGDRFLTFLKEVIRNTESGEKTRVWRVKFTPNMGVSVFLLDPAGVEDVSAGEDRVGFLPRWYWEAMHKDGQDASGAGAFVLTGA